MTGREVWGGTRGKRGGRGEKKYKVQMGGREKCENCARAKR